MPLVAGSRVFMAWAAHLHLLLILPGKCLLLDHLESAQKKELTSPASRMVCSNICVWFPAVITIVSTFCPLPCSSETLEQRWQLFISWMKGMAGLKSWMSGHGSGETVQSRTSLHTSLPPHAACHTCYLLLLPRACSTAGRLLYPRRRQGQCDQSSLGHRKPSSPASG